MNIYKHKSGLVPKADTIHATMLNLTNSSPIKYNKMINENNKQSIYNAINQNIWAMDNNQSSLKLSLNNFPYFVIDIHLIGKLLTPYLVGGMPFLLI